MFLVVIMLIALVFAVVHLLLTIVMYVVVMVHLVRMPFYLLEHSMLQEHLKFYMILVAQLLVSSLMFQV